MTVEEMYRLLANAGRMLAVTLDFGRTLKNVSSLLIPQVADWFAVDLINDSGDLERVHVSHADPLKLSLAHDLFAKHPPQRLAPRGQWHVIRTGQPEWSADIDDAWVNEMSHDSDHRLAIASLTLRSYIRVPLIAAGKTLGVLTVVYAESGRHYGESDLEPMTRLGELVAFAVQNAQAHARLKALTDRKDEFLATLAHELRNPLAPVLSSAQVLDRAATDPERVRTLAAVIHRQAKHMISLVEDLLDVARVSRGDFGFSPKCIELTGAVQQSIEQVRPQFEKRNHVLATSGLADPLWVNADSTRLVQVISNVLSNAARYTPDGGHIRLNVRTEDRKAVIEISDDGIGIPPDFLPHVFDLFSQHSRGIERNHAGLGIGLALVKRLVERHGGTVLAHSAGAGQGSTFTILLPLIVVPALTPTAPRERASDPA